MGTTADGDTDVDEDGLEGPAALCVSVTLSCDYNISQRYC